MLIHERISASEYLIFFPIRYQGGPYSFRRHAASVSTSMPRIRATRDGVSNGSKEFMIQLEQPKSG